MGLPGENNQEGGPYPDAINRSDQFPNPNKFLLRNIFGTQNVGWSNESGASPFSFNFENPIVPTTNFGIPWVPGPQMGWNPTNISVINFNGGFGENGMSGNNGANGTNGSGGAVAVRYYTSGGDVTVDPTDEIYFDFPDGYVFDDGNGTVTVQSPSGGSVGTLTANVPLTGGGNMASNQSVGLSYDSTDSFQLSAGTTLQLKTITVTAPSDAGAVTAITTDNFGRVTSYTRQFHGVYKITGSTFVSPGHWEYAMIEQTSLSGTWPFFQSGSNTITAYNLLETANTSSVAYGLPSVGTAAPIELTSQEDYKMYPVPNDMMVEVWKWGSRYFFSAPNKIDGACP
jgi:hypothetical protein